MRGRFKGGNGSISVTGGTFNQTGAATRLFAAEAGTGVISVGGSGVINSAGGLVLGSNATATAPSSNAGGTLNTAYVGRPSRRAARRWPGRSARSASTAARSPPTPGRWGPCSSRTLARHRASGRRDHHTAVAGVTVAQGLLHDPNLGATPDGGLTKLGAKPSGAFRSGYLHRDHHDQCGTLQIGTGGAAGGIGAGEVIDDAALVYSRSDTTAFANLISGSGTFEKQGTGTLTVGDANDYTGQTTVSAGTLRVASIGNGGRAVPSGLPPLIRLTWSSAVARPCFTLVLPRRRTVGSPWATRGRPSTPSAT